MKPFLMSVLKCPVCDFSKRLRVSASRVSRIDVGDCTSFLSSRKGYFIENCGEALRDISDALRRAEGDPYLLDVDKVLSESSTPAELGRFLLGNEIERGSVTCDGCREVYPIEDGIVSFIKDRKDETNRRAAGSN